MSKSFSNRIILCIFYLGVASRHHASGSTNEKQGSVSSTVTLFSPNIRIDSFSSRSNSFLPTIKNNGTHRMDEGMPDSNNDSYTTTTSNLKKDEDPYDTNNNHKIARIQSRSELVAVSQTFFRWQLKVRKLNTATFSKRNRKAPVLLSSDEYVVQRKHTSGSMIQMEDENEPRGRMDIPIIRRLASSSSSGSSVRRSSSMDTHIYNLNPTGDNDDGGGDNDNNKDTILQTKGEEDDRSTILSTLDAAWVPEEYPNPINEPTKCNIESLLPTTLLPKSSSRLYLCDPDSVLSSAYLNRITSAIFQTIPIQAQHFKANSSISNIVEKDTNTIVPVQIAVAIVGKIDLAAVLHSRKSFYSYEEEEDMINDAAQYFSRFLYDAWFVDAGTVGAGDTNGILIFLSIKDRVCFISTGSSISVILPWWRLERIITTDMKVDLRRHNFGEAVLRAIDDIKYTLELGPPTVQDKVQDFLERFGVVLGFCIVTFIFALYGEYRDKIRRYRYTEHRSKLSEKEYKNAQLLMLEYSVHTCPICLEPFSFDHASQDKNESNIMTSCSVLSSPSICKGNDQLPLKLLRCGHAFDQTCWKCWVTSGYGNPWNCPVCRQDIGGPQLQQPQPHTPTNNANSITAPAPTPTTTRSSITTRILNRLALLSATTFFTTSATINDDNGIVHNSVPNLRNSSTHGPLTLPTTVMDEEYSTFAPETHYGTFDTTTTDLKGDTTNNNNSSNV